MIKAEFKDRKTIIPADFKDKKQNKITAEFQLELVFVKHYAPNCLTLHCLTPTLLAHDGNNSTNIRDFNVILLKGNNSTRIPRIGCVACLKHQPFDMKKEKKKTLVLIIAPIPKGDQVEKGP